MVRTKSLRPPVAALALAGAFALLPQPSAASEARWKVGSAAATVFYAPAKVVYASLGVVFGGIGWGLSGGDPGVFDAVVAPAVNGDYVVRPEHLRGERSLEFVGHPDTAPALATTAAPEDPYDPYAPLGSDDPFEDDPYAELQSPRWSPEDRP